ncbi:MAG TPA: hypothetical protein VJ810_33165 [Blastocatellia bacterium]|nr:hypothetical protein [Blastocatellia bacterium]
MQKTKYASALLAAMLAATIISFGQTAPDATPPGPFPTTSSEYKLPAAIDPLVAPEIATELWARVYRPANLNNAPYPVLIFLHGNHATCGRFEGAGQGRLDINIQYTFTGTCPPGFVVVPSHEGYAYFAERLASWGYIVVSINANRGVNAAPGVAGDGGLNLRRGRLILRHLQKLAAWNSGSEATPGSLGFSLQGKLDFNHVGMMGHSRGGEGVRAALAQFRDAGSIWPGLIGVPVKFEGIFEIGPVDGQTGRILNAEGLAWNVLLPMCDGDVFNLQGVRVFDRMLANRTDNPATQKSTFTVWGANHNFYNTEWQVSDSPGCLGHSRLFDHLLGSADQRQTSLSSVLAFFRAHVGANKNPDLANIFNPQFALPASLANVTRVDRGYTDSPNSAVTEVFEDFDRPTGINTSGNANDASNITITHAGIANHSSVQRVARISWDNPGAGTFFQSNWTAPNSGRNVTAFETLDFRVSAQCKDLPCNTTDSGFNFETNFSIRLVGANGSLSNAVRLRDFASLTGPVGGLVRGIGSSPHPILLTARIPLTAFGNAPLTSLRGIRFTFDDTRHEDIHIGNIRLSRVSGTTSSIPISADLPTSDSPLDLGTSTANEKNNIKSVKSARSSQALPNQSSVEIELTSNREFLPQGELLVLKVGSQETTLSRYGEEGSTNRIIFTLTAEQWSQINTGDPVVVQYGAGAGADPRNFGHIDKNMLR